MSAMFDNKVAIVTGAASGIGRAAALRFATEGAKVCLADLNGDGAAALASEIGANAISIKVDVSSRADNHDMFSKVVDKFGRVDAAFLNAGYLGPMNGFAELDEDLLDRHLSINLKGALWGIQSAMAHMTSGGSVVINASTAGLIGLSESPAYSASKHAIIGLMKSTSSALAQKGIRINAVCPGGVSTPMMGAPNVAIKPSSDLEMIPLRGIGTAQHVAEFALWLCSPAAGYITGHAHVIDAGLLASFWGGSLD